MVEGPFRGRDFRLSRRAVDAETSVELPKHDGSEAADHRRSPGSRPPALFNVERPASLLVTEEVGADHGARCILDRLLVVDIAGAENRHLACGAGQNSSNRPAASIRILPIRRDGDEVAIALHEQGRLD